MTNQEFKKIVNDSLAPIGFNQKGNLWTNKLFEINKMVQLQKSSFSNLYYINYGFVINGLSFDNSTMHIFNRMQSSDAYDLEIKMSDNMRNDLITQNINSELKPAFESVNSVDELKVELQKRKHLNDVPLAVKKYLSLE